MVAAVSALCRKGEAGGAGILQKQSPLLTSRRQGLEPGSRFPYLRGTSVPSLLPVLPPPFPGGRWDQLNILS